MNNTLEPALSSVPNSPRVSRVLPRAQRFAVLTCTDARLDSAKFAGLAEGEPEIIRNAGGRATDDAIRGLVISHRLLGAREWFVVHHTDCGLLLLPDDIAEGLRRESVDDTRFDPATGWTDPGGGGSAADHYADWLTIKNSSRSVVDHVDLIRRHPAVPRTIAIYGYIYDVRTGRLIEVPAATWAGRVSQAA